MVFVRSIRVFLVAAVPGATDMQIVKLFRTYFFINLKYYKSMKKVIFTSVILFAIVFSSIAQRAENATVTSNAPLREYLRPSLTTIYIDRGEPLSQRIIEQMVKKGISGKFNDNSIERNVLTIDKDQKFTSENMRQILEEDVAREVIRCWFPVFDTTMNEFSTHVVAERGLYNASDADIIAARAAHMNLEDIKTKGLDLIGRSYILVYDIYNAKRLQDDEKEGYQADCDVYLYHMDWEDETVDGFYERFSDPNGIDSSYFPVVHIASFVEAKELIGIKISQSSQGDFLRLSDEKLFTKFVAEIEKKAEVYLTKVNEDFKVKSTLFAVSPLRAKIGTKEGVKVDQRYFVYEIRQNDAGDQSTVRKGVMRATSKIAKNDTVATGQGPSTVFYQTYGKILRPGMLIQQQPDWGTGYSLLVGTDFQFLVELSAVMWMAKYIPALDDVRFPYGTKLYIKYSYPFGKMEIEGIKLDENISSGFLGFGLSKDFYFAHYFSATPYLGFQGLLLSEEDQEYAEEAGIATSGLEFGLNGSMGILHNLQVVGNVGWSTIKSKWYSTGLMAGVGIRYQY
jgi:hypothetical protein